MLCTVAIGASALHTDMLLFPQRAPHVLISPLSGAELGVQTLASVHLTYVPCRARTCNLW